MYTFYPGSRLIQQEAVLTTNDADVAYYYDAGLDMGAPTDRTPGNNMRSEISYYDTSGTLKTISSTGFRAERQPVQVRHRTLAAKTAGGSVAVFPAPHQYFFPRDFSSNLGYLWHRSWRGRVGIGVRQLRDENWQYYPWMNAPPGRAQRMGVFFLVSEGAPEAALTHVLRYTNGDRFPALAGYKTLSTHWHLADTVQAMAHGQKWTPPFKPVLKAMGVDATMIMDFHGDGHPADLTDLRLDELDAYFKSLKAQSDPEFLLIPAEEANVHLGGHWSVVFPKPVYWFMSRPEISGRGVRDAASEIREGLQRGERAGDARSRAPRGRLHVPDTSADQGLNRLPGQDSRDRSLPRSAVSRRRMEGDAVGPCHLPGSAIACSICSTTSAIRGCASASSERSTCSSSITPTSCTRT